MLRFISGGACIGWLRKWLWMPIEHHSYKSLSTAAQTHILSLSCDFHDNKTTSDLNQAINGGRSVTSLLETMCFQVVPNFIDLAVAFAYLWSHFGPYMGLLLLFVVTSYLYTTTKLAAMRVELRREYITSYRKEWTVGYQSLDNWTTATVNTAIIRFSLSHH
jgi:ABC-type transport system involved in Fe-S cluster assembly fused permease/ATPase subunit